MQHHLFTLFVTGQTPTSEAARENLKTICKSHLGDRCEVVIVDVLDDPEIAELHRVMATPTLIKASPLPARRIIGDLSDTARVLAVLGLTPNPAPEEPVSGSR